MVVGFSPQIVASSGSSRRRRQKYFSPRTKRLQKPYNQRTRGENQGSYAKEYAGPKRIAIETPKTNEVHQAKIIDLEIGNGVEEIYLNGKGNGRISLWKHEMEEFLREKAMKANLRKEVERLVSETQSRNEKTFSYLEVVTPDQEIEIFLNKCVSVLNNETSVFITGAFNDWRYKSFTRELTKTHFPGEWWACKIYVPKEAYKIDFVFFNGRDVHENNSSKDFCINVKGGIGILEFEDVLLEEKRKEEAEKEREREEKRRIKAEKAASEGDREEARVLVKKRRERIQVVLKKSVESFENVWFFESSEFKGGDIVRLYYNKSSGPLVNAKGLWIHGGYNNWQDGLSIVSKLVESEKKDKNWWHVDVFVPARALVLNWVFENGPPQLATLYDNNLHNDYHAIIPTSIPQYRYWADEEHEIFKKLNDERKFREEESRAKAEKTARLKAEKNKNHESFLLSQKNVVYTEPLDVKAGEPVTIFYNPTNSVLNGKPEIWFRFKVPLDAYMMDFVFSEKESNDGAFDNQNGNDYHVPVFGGVAKEPPMHIVHIAIEMAPIAKVGGLADVVTSLSRAVQDLNHKVDIILPKYDCLQFSNVKDLGFHWSYSWGGTEIKVWLGKVDGLPVYFLEPQNGLFWACCIYGCRNDAQRFSFFSHAALEFLLQSGSLPVIHCHDWSSAPVAWLLKDHYMHHPLGKASVVFTIHNLEFGAHLIGKAMAFADKAITVSPTYSQEVAGNPVIAPHLHKFRGILNGIDPDIWDPYNDKFLPVCYTPDNVIEGKRAAKEALQQKLGLKKTDLPLVGIITRLTHQKGIHLIKHTIWRTLDRGGQVVLLGSAPDPNIQNDFVNLANQLHS